jgi:dephospho-CoA kinase
MAASSTTSTAIDLIPVIVKISYVLMRVLGLTGGIGSGKSTVASMFAQLGAEVIDADALAREVVQPGQPALEEILQTFGTEMRRPDGGLDRARLGALVFADPAARARLNAITHPRVRARMQAEVERRQGRRGLLILDIPLLYENARMDAAQKVIVVWVDPQTQLRRLTEREGMTVEAARSRIAAQLPLDDKKALADHVIDNGGSLTRTRSQVETLYRQYDDV